MALPDKVCEICGKTYTPKYDWSKNCYECFKAGKVPKSKQQARHDQIMTGLREIYKRLVNIENGQKIISDRLSKDEE